MHKNDESGGVATLAPPKRQRRILMATWPDEHIPCNLVRTVFTFNTLIYDPQQAQGGFRLGELREAFARLCTVQTWRNPIDRVEQLNGPDQVRAARHGIAWFQGCVPDIVPLDGQHFGMPGRYRIVSAGMSSSNQRLIGSTSLAVPVAGISASGRMS